MKDVYSAINIKQHVFRGNGLCISSLFASVVVHKLLIPSKTGTEEGSRTIRGAMQTQKWNSFSTEHLCTIAVTFRASGGREKHAECVLATSALMESTLPGRRIFPAHLVVWNYPIAIICDSGSSTRSLLKHLVWSVAHCQVGCNECWIPLALSCLSVSGVLLLNTEIIRIREN